MAWVWFLWKIFYQVICAFTGTYQGGGFLLRTWFVCLIWSIIVPSWDLRRPSARTGGIPPRSLPTTTQRAIFRCHPSRWSLHRDWLLQVSWGAFWTKLVVRCRLGGLGELELAHLPIFGDNGAWIILFLTYWRESWQLIKIWIIVLGLKVIRKKFIAE